MDKRVNQNNRAAWLGISLAAFLFLFPPAVLSQERQKTYFMVENLSCGGCLVSIETELTKLKGFSAMNGDLATGVIEVEHTAQLSPAVIKHQLAGIGYDARRTAQTPPLLSPGSGGKALKEDSCVNCLDGCTASSDTWRELFHKIWGAVRGTKTSN